MNEYHSILYYYSYVLRILYIFLFIQQRTFALLLYLSYYNSTANMKVKWILFSFFRTLRIIFHNGCTALNFCCHYAFPPLPLMCFDCLKTDIWKDMRVCLLMIPFVCPWWLWSFNTFLLYPYVSLQITFK